MIRIAAALEKATSRQSFRDAFATRDVAAVEVLASSGRSLISRPGVEDANYVVLDASLGDIEVALDWLRERDLVDRAVIITRKASEARGHDVASSQIVEADLGAADCGVHVRRAMGFKQVAIASPAAETPSAPPPDRGGFKRREMVVIGCSTGGPQALAKVFETIPATFPVPIVIVQHMPPDFTKMLADRLDKASPLTVREVTEPVTAKKGEVWIAPGHQHLVFANSAGALELDDGPEENNCKPAVDVLFRSAAHHYGRRTVGVVLTGMGDDGARGGQKLIQSGAHMICQDEKTSVVWGMPGATIRANAASEVLPLNEVGAAICAQFATRIPVGAQR